MKFGSSALRAFAALSATLCTFAAHGNGTVAQMSGTVSVQKPDGAVRLLSRQSEVGRGDTINTERDSYAQVRFSDGAVMTLKPNTRIRIEEYAFDQAQPTRDNSTMALVKGGLRMITGLIGKRGNQDALRLGTATATIGIRGTTFSVDDCVTSVCTKRGATRTSAVGGADFALAGSETMLDFPDATDDPERFQAWVNLDRMLNGTPRDPFALLGQRYAQAQEQCADCLPPAVYVGVSDGEIVVANSSGNTNFRAGQFGSVASFSARPSTLPGDPGLPIYTPPTSFFQNISGGGVRNANTQCLTN